MKETCQRCRSKYPSDSPGGICPRCIVSSVLRSDDDDADRWLNSNSDQPKPGAEIGPWKVAGKLGEGAFGEVFRASQRTPLKRQGALKILKPGMDSREILGRFEAERQAMAELNHPNIANIIDAGQTEKGRPWFVMDLIEGLPVTQFCEDRNLNLKERLRLFVQICDAVNHAHSHEIVHRDLKPSNILVSMNDHDTPQATVIDFGIAKATGSPLTERTIFTHTGVLIGTPEYMSPEQASGKSLDLDARADVYSLGVLLYELLTGTTPISKTQLQEAAFDEILRTIRETEAERPSTQIKELRKVFRMSDSNNFNGFKLAPELDWIALKALEKDRTRRYCNAGEFGEDVQRFLDDQPVLARKPDVVYRTAKFFRRHRKATIGTGIAAGLVFIAAIAGWAASQKLTSVSPELLAASEFRRVSMLSHLPDTPESIDSKFMEASTGIDNYPETVAQLCRRLRDQPDDDHARFRLWGLMSIVQYPERIGDPIVVGDEITGADLLPEQKLGVVISKDGFFRAFSLQDGTEKFSHDCGAPLSSLTVDADKGMAAAAGENGHLFAVDFASGGERQQFYAGESPLLSLSLTKQGVLLSGDESGNIQAWAVKQGGGAIWTRKMGSAIHLLSAHHSDLIFACVLKNGDAQVFSSETGEASGPILKTGMDPVGLSISYHNDGLIVAGKSGRMGIWNYKTGDKSREQVTSGEKPIHTFTSNPYSSVFLAGTDDEAVVLGMITESFRVRIPSDSRVTALNAGTSESRYILTGHADGSFRMWNEKYKRSEIDPIQLSSTDPVSHLSVDKQVDFLVATAGATAQIWDLQYRPGKLKRFNEAGYVTQMAAIRGTNLIRFMGPNGSILFRLESTAPAGQTMPIPLGSTHTALSKNGFWISAAYENRVQTWKAPINGAAIPMREIKCDSAVSTIALSHGGEYIAIGTESGGGGVWKTETGKQVFRLKSNSSSDPVSSTAVGLKFVAFGGESGSTRIFEFEKRRNFEIGGLTFSSPVDSLAISNKGTIAAGDRNGIARLFDPEKEEQIGADLKHKGGIISLDFSPDGRWISCGTRNKYCSHWDARDGRYLYRSRRWIGEMVVAGMNHEQTYFIQCSTRSSGPTYQRIPPHNDPIPPILLDYAEAFVGFRIDENGVQQTIPFAEYARIRSELASLKEDGNRVNHWLKFMATNSSKRNSVPDF